MADYFYSNGELYHWGVKGMKWGVRRFQKKDGSLTSAGKKRYSDGEGSTRAEKKAAKAAAKEAKKNSPEAIAKKLQRQETIEKGKEFLRQNGKTIALGVGTAAAMALGMHYLTPVINSAANVRLATSNKMDRLDAMESTDYTSASREATSARGSSHVTSNKQSRLDAMDSYDPVQRSRTAYTEQVLAEQAFERAGQGKTLTDYEYDILRRQYSDH